MTIEPIAVIAGILVNIFLLVGGIYTAIRWLKNWIRQQVQTPAKQVQKKVDDNKETIDSFILIMGRRFDVIENRLDPINRMYDMLSAMDENQQLLDRRITHANDIALIALRRIDETERKNDA